MNSLLSGAFPWRSPPHKKESNEGRSTPEILLEFKSTVRVSDAALHEAVSGNISSHGNERPHESITVDNEIRALCVNVRRNLGIKCSRACQRLLRFCTRPF